MSSDADAGAGTPASANGSGIPSGGSDGTGADIEQRINDAVNKALSRRLPRAQNTEELIAKKVEEALAKFKADPQPDHDAGDGASAKPGTNKALQAQIDSLTRQVKEEADKRKAAEDQSRDQRIRGTVGTAFAKHLGADSPHLAPYLATYHDVQKRFVEDDGVIAVKCRRDGIEELMPLEEGVKQLFDTELKHLVESKAARLPPAGMPGLRGQPLVNGGRPRAPSGLDGVFAAMARDLGTDPGQGK